VTDSNGEPTEAIKDKATFHRLDALRYVAQGVMGRALPFGWMDEED
jgi:hypothetical protein